MKAPALDEDRLTRTQIAFRSKIDRATVFKYLARAGAPKPDRKGLFSYREAIAFIEKTAPRATSGNDDQKSLRTALLRVQLERAQLELSADKGEFLSKEQIGPAIQAFMSQLTSDLTDTFERELPPKCHGRPTVEIAELMAAAVDRVLKRLKDGAAPLVR